MTDGATGVATADPNRAVCGYIGDGAFLEERPSEPLVLDARTVPEVARPGFPPY